MTQMLRPDRASNWSMGRFALTTTRVLTDDSVQALRTVKEKGDH